MRSLGSRGPAVRDSNPAASMALLEEVLDPPIGPGYHSAAQRRVEAGLPSSSGTRTWLMLVVCLLLGLLATVAATTLRLPDPVAAEARQQLIVRIEAAEAAGDAQRDQVDLLRAEIVTLEQQAHDTVGAEPSADIGRAGMLAGASAVTGPGVVILIEDAPRPADGTPGEQADRERVNARDVQLVVNALWAAGAEAVSVNEHRLTSTSAIRFAGQAIVVDFRSLAPPYEIRAIGDPVVLAEETSSGFVAAYLSELRTQVGLPSTVTASDQVQIPAATRLTTRVGSVVEGPLPEDPTPGDPGRSSTPSAPPTTPSVTPPLEETS